MVIEAVDRSQQTLLARLLSARAETDALFQTVKTEAIYDRPIAERHRIIFYIGHLEAFDKNLLSLASSHTEFDNLFAFGIDPLGGNLPTDLPQDWPALVVVNQYRDQTRAHVDSLIDDLAARGDSDFDVKMNVAIEHRLMHAETLAYIFHQLPFDRKQGQDARSVVAHRAAAPALVEIPAGNATLGLRRDSPTFGWDNEFEELTVHVPAFTIDKYKVNNGQFLKFLNEGGYQESSLWSPADWEWRTAQEISHPVFWARRGGSWMYRAMFGEVPLPLSEPVYVSHAEANAYTRWAGRQLPTEPEWQRAAYGAAGVEDLHSTGWEWTSTPFAGFPGFQPMPFYMGYSEPFFDGKHYVLKGGSPRTAPVMLRPSFRNWFQPHYQYVYAGFRCAGEERS